MPFGKVKRYDAAKGMGRTPSEDGRGVFLSASALEPGADRPVPGARMEFEFAQDRRGPQAKKSAALLRTVAEQIDA